MPSNRKDEKLTKRKDEKLANEQKNKKEGKPENDQGNEQLKKSPRFAILSKINNFFNSIFPTKQIADASLSRELALRTSILEGIIFLAFVAALGIYVSFIQPSWSYDVTQALKKTFIDREFTTINEAQINFNQIKSAADVWEYLDNVVSVQLSKSLIAQQNIIIGFARLRQLRVRNQTCPIYKYFSTMILRCYNAYGDMYLDKATIPNAFVKPAENKTEKPPSVVTDADGPTEGIEEAEVERRRRRGQEDEFSNSTPNQNDESVVMTDQMETETTDNQQTLGNVAGIDKTTNEDFSSDASLVNATSESDLNGLGTSDEITSRDVNNVTYGKRGWWDPDPTNETETETEVSTLGTTTEAAIVEITDEPDRDPLPFKVDREWRFIHATNTYFSHPGKLTSYSYDGQHQDLPPRGVKMRNALRMLKRNLWLGLGTRALFLHFTVYNPNVNMICATTLLFEFPPSGGVIPSASFVPFQLTDETGFMKFIVVTVQPVIFGFIVFFIIEELREILFFGWRYFLQFWTYVDVFIIVLAILCIPILVLFNSVKSDLLGTIAPSRNIPDSESGETKGPADVVGYIDFVPAAEMYVLHKSAFAILFFVCCVKILKYMDFMVIVDHVRRTILRSLPDLAAFSCMLLTVFVGFAELGYILFGSTVEDFSSFFVSLFTLFRIILGDFDYMKAHEAEPFFASVFFSLFIFIVVFILINMFLAILFCVYFEVKTLKAIRPEITMGRYLLNTIMTIIRFFKIDSCFEYFKRFFTRGGTMKRYRTILSDLGFTEDEIDDMFNHYGIDPSTDEPSEDEIMFMFADIALPPKKPSLKTDEKSPADKGRKRIKEFESNSYVRMDDFKTQQKILEDIENLIISLNARLDEAIAIVSD